MKRSYLQVFCSSSKCSQSQTCLLISWTQWPITGVQKINGCVCDWLHCSMLQNLVNRNFLSFYKICFALSEGDFDCVRKWTCGMKVWEQCQLLETSLLPSFISDTHDLTEKCKCCFSKLEAQSSSKFIYPSDSKIKVRFFLFEIWTSCFFTATEDTTFTNSSGRSYGKRVKSSDVIHSIYKE